MFAFAIQSLLHEKWKIAGATAGVAFATSLILIQTGFLVGFRHMTASVITRVGGELWVASRGTRLFDNSLMLSSGVRNFVASPACVVRARGVVSGWGRVRTPSGAVKIVQVVGYEPGSRDTIPWSLRDGLPSDLHSPRRVSVDAGDLANLELPARAIGSELELVGRWMGPRPESMAVYVGAITKSIRSFTVSPFIFTEARTAQRLFGLGENQFTYWALDLPGKTCDPADVVRSIERNPDLDVHTPDHFGKITGDFWLTRSGAGKGLTFTAVLGFIVGLVIVGQNLYALTESRIRELATLKVLGASNRELLAFVGWQAAFFAVVGGGIGVLQAFAMQMLAAKAGLVLALPSGVIALGLGSTAAMCAFATFVSTRKLIKLDAASVFR